MIIVVFWFGSVSSATSSTNSRTRSDRLFLALERAAGVLKCVLPEVKVSEGVEKHQSENHSRERLDFFLKMNISAKATTFMDLIVHIHIFYYFVRNIEHVGPANSWRRPTFKNNRICVTSNWMSNERKIKVHLTAFLQLLWKIKHFHKSNNFCFPSPHH